MISIKYLLASLLLISFIDQAGFAAPPVSQSAGGFAGRQEFESRKKKLEARIEEIRMTEPETFGLEAEIQSDERKVFIEDIVVEGASLLNEKELAGIVEKYEGRELSFQDMQKLTTELTDRYRQRGYVTSRAYIPPQKIKKNVLGIRIVEGRLGDLEVKGSKFFKPGMLERKIDFGPEGYFDYSALQRSLVYINEHPDRKAKAVLTPGREPGTTDVIIEVDDRVPVHAGFEYDNWGSRFIDRNRYAVIFEHNNVLGYDDKLFLKGQAAENQQMTLGQARYTYPLNTGLELGVYTLYSKVRPGEEFAAFDSTGDAEIYGIFGIKRLIVRDAFDIRFNFGFDYKSISDDFADVELSRDEVRVIRGGFDIDWADRWGRTIFTVEVDQGISEVMGAMEKKDPMASRTGAGSKFTKSIFNLFRLQPMPFETFLLWKNIAQYTNHRLIAAEQFQIGGAASVRGYSPAEFSGDKGFYMSMELSIPWYFLSKTARVPFYKQDRWYDALRFVLFWDWAYVNRIGPAFGEEETDTLQGAGFGVRFNLSEHLDCRVEIGYPLGGPVPSDGDHMHPWIEFNYKF
ncbi:MAG: ShlB/FhaC/HecB family hemolysin secretion/activation protein [Candidatus Omnitrophota bacterium]